MRIREAGAWFGWGAIGMVFLTACGGHSSGSTSVAPSLSSLYVKSVGNMEALQTGLGAYFTDYDDVLPFGNKWMDETTIYVNDPAAYKSPAVSGAGYGYAMNSVIAGLPMSQFASPNQVVTFFDSTDVAHNATDSIGTMPNPPRYGSKNTIGYLDGSTQDSLLTQSIYQLSTTSLYRVKQVSLATLLYANDYDDVNPLSASWVDGELPYSKSIEIFRSPLIESQNPSEFGYAMNSVVAGQNVDNFPAISSLISIFDSTDLLRNATDPTTTLPNPGRYYGANTIGFADGHAQKIFTPSFRHSATLRR